VKPKHGSGTAGINAHVPFLPQIQPKRQDRRRDNGNRNQYVFLLHDVLVLSSVTRNFSCGVPYSIIYQVSSCFTSNGPKSISTCTWTLPLKSFGTRHEYRQTPPQPY
jgi:hypothetical protein